MKRIIQLLLLALVVTAIGVWASGQTKARKAITPPEAPVQDTVAVAENPPVVLVTYFTTDQRCESCREIEALTWRTVGERFAEQVNEGKLQFRTLNLDRPENAHFAKDYGMSFKTVVISTMAGGEERSWQKMDDVWKLLGKNEVFMDYVGSGISQALGADL
jgi:hypothetical protein